MADADHYPAGTMRIRGQEFPVTVRLGGFCTMIDGSEVTARTWDDLADKVMKATAFAATHVDVPFIVAEQTRHGHGTGWRIRYGSGTGVHGGTGNVIIRWTDHGVSEQLNRGGPFLHPQGTEDVAEWLRLLQARDDADQALIDFTGPRRLRLADEVRRQVSERLEAAVGQPERRCIEHHGTGPQHAGCTLEGSRP